LLTSLKPSLDWKNSSTSSSTSFDHYQLQLAKDSGFSDIALDANIADQTGSIYTPAADLKPNTRYYWHVRAFNTLGQYSNWSKAIYFREAMLAPVLGTPENGASVTNLRPEFEWKAVEGASSYTIQISAYNSMKSRIVSTKVTEPTYTPTKNLSKNKTLYWRVRANGDNGPSSWSEVWSFLTPAQ
jgi:hypothetical protein